MWTRGEGEKIYLERYPWVLSNMRLSFGKDAGSASATELVSFIHWLSKDRWKHRLLHLFCARNSVSIQCVLTGISFLFHNSPFQLLRGAFCSSKHHFHLLQQGFAFASLPCFSSARLPAPAASWVTERAVWLSSGLTTTLKHMAAGSTHAALRQL